MIPLLFTASCKVDNIDEYVEKFENDGTFFYYKGANDKGYSLCGQVNLALGDNVYIPPYFNGKAVTTLGCTWATSWNAREVIFPLFHNVRNLYFSYLLAEIDYGPHVDKIFYVQSLKDPFVVYSNNGPEKIFVPNMEEDFYGNEVFLHVYSPKYCYVTQTAFDKLKSRYVDYRECVYKMNLEGIDFQVANTTFMFNYEQSPNKDVFFINDFVRGGLIENVPYGPMRDGYAFAGWYKEPTCINKWDFENDTLPAPQYDEEGELIFAETKLYAKWI